MEFYNVSWERAVAFRDHVVAREPYMVRELVVWMEQTGGPIELMDGSVESLVPMWEWYLDLARAEFLGLTEGLVPSASPELAELGRSESDEVMRQSQVGGDRLMHYVRLVLTRLVPQAYWGVYTQPKGPVEDVRHQTVLFLPGWPHPRRRDIDWAAYLMGAGGMADVALYRGAFESDRLRKWVEVYECPPGLVPRRQERLASVLVPYLGVVLPPMPEVARVSPVVGWLADPPPVSVPRRGGEGEEDWEEMVLARGPGLGLQDEPWLLFPLPVDRVAAALTAAGFAGVDEAALLAGEEFDHPKEVAHVMTLVHDGSLRAVLVEPVDPTSRSWKRVTAPLRALAADLGAHFLPEDTYPD